MKYELVDEDKYNVENNIVLRVPYAKESYGLYNVKDLNTVLREWNELTRKIQGITDAIQSIYESESVDFDDLNSIIEDYDLNVHYSRNATVTVTFDMSIKCSPVTSAMDAAGDIDFAFDSDLISYYEVQEAKWEE